jgi:PhnB protein
MNVQTYLYFDGCCEDAIKFYTDVFGAEQEFLMRFKDGPADMIPAGAEEKIFHATLRFGNTRINASDAFGAEVAPFGGFALLVHFDVAEEAARVFEGLQASGQTIMPLQAVPWATCYGIVQDRFGIRWKLQVNG